MFATLVSIALFSSLALRGACTEFEISTPTLTQCQTANITWQDTVAGGPYSLIVVSADDICGDELANLGDFYGTSTAWTVNMAALTQVVLSMLDSAGNEAWSNSITIGSSDDSSCLTVSSVVSGSATASASGTSVTSSAIVTAGAVANDVPGSGSSTATASSSGAQAVGAANTGDDPTSAGFSIHQLSAPLVGFSAIVAFVLSL